jgi:predicted metalloendopeptidase
LSTGALYVREYFDKTDKKEALIMIDNLRAAFIELVEQLEWMDEKTKIVAIEKVNEH